MENLVRLAEQPDCAAIVLLLEQIGQYHHDARRDVFKENIKKYDLSDVEQIVQNKNTPVFVAVGQDNKVLGYVFCQIICHTNHKIFHDKAILFIDDFCVDSALRSSGVGKSLLAHVKSFAKEHNFGKIELNVWAFNDSAIAFYEKQGFTTQRIRMEMDL